MTNSQVLAELAGSVGLETQQFLRAFESDAARDITQGHFDRARHLGVHGFPTLVGQHGVAYAQISSGYCPVEELNPKISQWLDS